MKNMWGATSAKLDPLAGTLVCSAPDVSLRVRSFILAYLIYLLLLSFVILGLPLTHPEQRCSNIRVENVTVTVPSRKPPVYACSNVDEGLLDLTCVEPEDDRDTGQG
jgi:galacturan 1,4-alpha-galacturonidase